MNNTPPKFAANGYYLLTQAANGLGMDIRTLKKRAIGGDIKYHITLDKELAFSGKVLNEYWERYWTGLY